MNFKDSTRDAFSEMSSTLPRARSESSRDGTIRMRGGVDQKRRGAPLFFFCFCQDKSVENRQSGKSTQSTIKASANCAQQVHSDLFLGPRWRKERTKGDGRNADRTNATRQDQLPTTAALLLANGRTTLFERTRSPLPFNPFVISRETDRDNCSLSLPAYDDE